MTEDKIVDVPDIGFYYMDLTSQCDDIYKCVDFYDPDDTPFPYVMENRDGIIFDFSVYNWKKVDL